MSSDAVAICVAIFISILIGCISIAFGVFFGMRSFTSGVKSQLADAEDKLVDKLDSIKSTVDKIDVIADKAWLLFSSKFAPSTGTIEVTLQNFGLTKLSATPGRDGTTYKIEVERGKLDSSIMSKVSKETKFDMFEINLLGSPSRVTNLGTHIIILGLTCTEPDKCKQYISTFLKWLDTEYFDSVTRQIEAFEKGIEV